MSAPRNGSGLYKLGLLLLIGFIQSATIIAVDIAADLVAPLTLTGLRVSMASLALAGLLFLLRRGYPWQWRRAPDVAVLGLLNVALPFLALAVALAFISTSLAAALYQTVPVFTVVLASFLLPGERLNPARAAGTAVAVAGTVLVVFGGTSVDALGGQSLWGQSLILASSLVVAGGLVYARARVSDVDSLVLAAGQMFAAVAIIVPVALLIEGVPAPAIYPPAAWVATLVAAVATPVVGFWLVYLVVRRYGASLASFTGVATPFFSAAIGVALLGEVFTPLMAVGTLLLLGGLWILSRSYG